MIKLESDMQTLLTLMTKDFSSNEQQAEVVNKEHEQQAENMKPFTGTIASNAQGNCLHEATKMFTPIKVAKDIKSGELEEEMFDDIVEDNTGTTSLDINMTVTNILHLDAIHCDSVEANSQLLHACRNLNTKFDENILEYTKFENNIRHTSSICEGQEQINSPVPKPEVPKPKRGRG